MGITIGLDTFDGIKGETHETYFAVLKDMKLKSGIRVRLIGAYKSYNDPLPFGYRVCAVSAFTNSVGAYADIIENKVFTSEEKDNARSEYTNMWRAYDI